MGLHRSRYQWSSHVCNVQSPTNGILEGAQEKKMLLDLNCQIRSFNEDVGLRRNEMVVYASINRQKESYTMQANIRYERN
jgi:hypothetical protein